MIVMQRRMFVAACTAADMTTIGLHPSRGSSRRPQLTTGQLASPTQTTTPPVSKERGMTLTTDSLISTLHTDDYLMPPPNPADRLPCHIEPRDLRRLELHAVLTAAGIAPLPGDCEAIDQISALPAEVHQALHRWLTA